MKTRNILLTFLVSLLLISACEDREPITYDGPWFINIAEATYNVGEASTDPLQVEVVLAAPPQTAAVTVNFTVTSENAVEDTDYEILTDGGSITFEVGEVTQTIELGFFNNDDADGLKTVTVTLTDNSSGFILGVPSPDESLKSCAVLIADDDCSLVMADWVGTVDGNELSPWWDATDSYTFAAGAINETDRISLIVSGLFQPQLAGWGENWVTGGTVVVILDNTDPANPEVIIEPQYFGETVEGDGVTNWEYWVFQALGTGTFSTCDMTLSIPYGIAWDDTYSPSSWANFTVTFQF